MLVTAETSLVATCFTAAGPFATNRGGKGIGMHVDAIVTGSGPDRPAAANVLAGAGWDRARR